MKTVSELEKSIFLEKNHIQGDDVSSIKLGLFFENELISVMTFIKARYDKGYEYELSRYCNKLNTNIVGGASKLFKFFLETHNPTSVMTYSDRRLFSGLVYKQIGMSFLTHTIPGYYYFNKNNCTPINRINFQKHKLEKKLKIFNSELTEWENMQVNGFDRIWDCGHFKYVWNKPEI
jgi:hypothetical protein